MTESKLHKPTSIGTIQQITTLPFTAPCDGFIQVYMDPSDSSGGAYWVAIAGRRLHTSTTSGWGMTTCAPIKKGEIVSLEASVNISNASKVWFIPLSGGGSKLIESLCNLFVRKTYKEVA